MSDIIKDRQSSSWLNVEYPCFPAFSSHEDALDSIDSVAVREKKALDVRNAHQEAQEIVRQAQHQARVVEEQALKNVAQIQADARTAGYDEGMDNAMRSAQEQCAQAFEKESQQLRAVIEAFKTSYDDALKQSEAALVVLALSVAEKIIKEEAAKNNEIVMEMIKEGLSRLQEKSKIVLRLNPAQMQFIEERRKTLLSILEGVDNFELKEDPHVDMGGCIIETATGSVEARLDKQINEIRKVLTGKDKEDVNVSKDA